MKSLPDKLTPKAAGEVANSAHSLVSVSISNSSDEKVDRLTSSTASLDGSSSTNVDKNDDDELTIGLCVETNRKGEEVRLSTKTSRVEDEPSCKGKLCGSSARAVYGIVLLICGVTSFVWTPLNVMMDERLRMTPGFPAYEWWLNPPDEVLLRLYVFNITNHEEFLRGEDEKLNVQEVGPIVYREKLKHLNPRFNDNSTLTYTAQRTAIFLPEYNEHIDMNATLFLPNLAVLGMSSYLYNYPFFVKLGFKLMINKNLSPVVINTTIYQYLWNHTDPLVETARTLLPALVPVENMGILHRIYEDFTDENNVFIGNKWGDSRFFQLSSTRNSPRLPGYPESCKDEVTNSTEGVMYRQRIEKEHFLYYWRKSICKVVPLIFDEETVIGSVLAYRFNLSGHAFDRTSEETSTDCYKGSPVLKNGLSDASTCYYDFPIAASYPHFYAGDPSLKDYVNGLQPNEDKHSSYVIVEPLTGVPLEGCARSQSNLVVKELSGFGSDIDKFSDTVIPMFWIEYNQVSIPYYIYNLVYFTANVMPILQTVVSSLMLVLGTILTLKLVICRQNNQASPLKLLPLALRRQEIGNLNQNTMMTFEQEAFIVKTS